MKRTIIITGIIAAVAIIIMIAFNTFFTKKGNENIYAETIKGDFEIAVAASGELMAENSVEIKAPDIQQRGRDIRATNIKKIGRAHV